MNKKKIESATQQWLQEIVIDLNLCPFALKEYQSGGVVFYVSEATEEIQLMQELEQQLKRLQEDVSIGTLLLIHPSVGIEFSDYNQLLAMVDNLLEVMDLVGEFQIASFHPKYQFAGTQTGSPENYTNRSPFPMLHLLRESAVEQAIANYANIEKVPERNIQTMNQIGYAELQAKLLAIQNDQ